jgi:ribonucleases P/MRP protein subunit RPP40
MYVGHNGNDEYFLQENGKSIKLEAITEEKDLGVFITANMKPSKQCVTSAAKARSVLGLTHRPFRKFSNVQFLTIYKTYIRLHFEYAIQAWSPWLQKDIDCLEQVQRQATKLVARKQNLSYELRLDRLNLTTPEERRRGDLIETFKLLKGKENIEYKQFFQGDQNIHGLRGNDMKLFIPAVRTELPKNFFSHRVLKERNSLPQEVVEVDTVNEFKTEYDRFIKDMGNKAPAS